MRQIYFKHLSRSFSSTPDDYLEDRKVQPGEVLVINRVAAWHDNIATTEAMRFYVKIGHEYLWLGDDLPGTTGGPAHADLNIAIGEGMTFGCFAPSIASSELQHLVITGELWDRFSWQQNRPETE